MNGEVELSKARCTQAESPPHTRQSNHDLLLIPPVHTAHEARIVDGSIIVEVVWLVLVRFRQRQAPPPPAGGRCGGYARAPGEDHQGPHQTARDTRVRICLSSLPAPRAPPVVPRAPARHLRSVRLAAHHGAGRPIDRSPIDRTVRAPAVRQTASEFTRPCARYAIDTRPHTHLAFACSAAMLSSFLHRYGLARPVAITYPMRNQNGSSKIHARSWIHDGNARTARRLSENG
jgi:hypothetical protein